MTQPTAGTYADPDPDSDLDKIYRLLPPVIHLTDERAGRPLQALMRILARQANIVEEDLHGLYENWFIETCDDWVVPYLGELIGYKPVAENSTAEFDDTERGRARVRALVPRAEVANTVRFRRRKGSLLLLEELAEATVGWPARAVEYREMMATVWHSHFPERTRSRTLDLRRKDVLRNGYGPFTAATRLVDVRRTGSQLTPGKGNVSSLGLWVWRLKSMLVQAGWAGTRGRTELADHVHRFTFHPLGIKQPLFTMADRPPEPVGPADEFSVPAPITRRGLAENLLRYYGADKSLQLTYQLISKPSSPALSADIVEAFGDICPTRIEVADLTKWEKSLPSDHPFRRRDYPWASEDMPVHPYALIDPELGRMLVRPPIDKPGTTAQGRSRLKHVEFGIIVRYHFGSAAAIGGGDYVRRIPPAKEPWHLWNVSRSNDGGTSVPAGRYSSLRAALDEWDAWKDRDPSACRQLIIEIDDDGTFNLGIDTETRSRVTTVRAGEQLVIRAAAHRRPVIFISGGEEADYSWTVASNTDDVDDYTQPGSFALEGVMIGGINLIVSGGFERVVLRDCTIVAAEQPNEEHFDANAVLGLQNLTSCLSIERCIIVGAIQVDWDEFPPVPLTIEARDSILDGAGCPHRSPAITGSDVAAAFVNLLMQRCTVVGRTHVRRIELAEDTIFTGAVEVATPNEGCLRFCSIPAETALARPAKTPSRYSCQPDLFLRDFALQHPDLAPNDTNWQLQAAAQVQPEFMSRYFGSPDYMRLTDAAPVQIRGGASDESEMGAFHDLYLAQRMNLLRARLIEFVPAGTDPAIHFGT